MSRTNQRGAVQLQMGQEHGRPAACRRVWQVCSSIPWGSMRVAFPAFHDEQLFTLFELASRNERRWS